MWEPLIADGTARTPRFGTRAIVTALALAGFTAWGIAVAGVSALHKNCREEYDMFYVMDGTSDETCARMLSLPWFTVWCNLAFYSGVVMVVSNRSSLS